MTVFSEAGLLPNVPRGVSAISYLPSSLAPCSFNISRCILLRELSRDGKEEKNGFFFKAQGCQKCVWPFNLHWLVLKLRKNF